MSLPARFAAALNTFTSQYWLTKVEWDKPDKAFMQCAVATESILRYFSELGFENLFYVEVLGGKHFDPDAGTQIGARHYHTLARIGTVYLDLTYRQFDGQHETPWPLILTVQEVDDLWVKRRETSWTRDFRDSYTEWDELYK